MAESKPKKAPRRKKPETVRERATKAEAAKTKQPRRRRVTNAAKKPAGKTRQFLSTSLDVHDHKDSSSFMNFLTRRRSIVPAYVRGAFYEIRQVTWPKFPEAIRLTFAVIVFAFIFSLLIAGLDWVLSKIFEEVILNESQNIKDFISDIF